jgi:hypothetical protein
LLVRLPGFTPAIPLRGQTPPSGIHKQKTDHVAFLIPAKHHALDSDPASGTRWNKKVLAGTCLAGLNANLDETFFAS